MPRPDRSRHVRRANQSASPAAARPRQPKPPSPATPRNLDRREAKSSIAERIGASSSTSFSKEVADLGARVKQADEQFDRQLQQKFDHELGSTRLASVGHDHPPSQRPKPPSPAAQIAAMLANPDGVRQAMILNEILHRPTDRW